MRTIEGMRLKRENKRKEEKVGVRAGGTRNRGGLQCENNEKEGGDSRGGHTNKEVGLQQENK